MNKIASKMTENLLSIGVIDQRDIAIYRYGLEMLLLILLEIGSILCLAIMIGNFFETLLYFAAFIPQFRLIIFDCLYFSRRFYLREIFCTNYDVKASVTTDFGMVRFLVV